MDEFSTVIMVATVTSLAIIVAHYSFGKDDTEIIIAVLLLFVIILLL